MTTQVVPCYGTDYSSKQRFIGALKAGKEFMIMDISNEYNGKRVTLEELKRDGYTELKIRYNKLQRQAIIRMEEL